VLTVEVSGLKAGVYGYRVYSEDGELLKGKWIKE
jgi:hypothetical protein